MNRSQQEDLQQLKQLLTILRTTFKGASFGAFQVDEAANALERLLEDK